MAEIHDQFDTILILDFGSQVRFVQCFDLTSDTHISTIVQPSNHSEMSGAQCLCGTYAMYDLDQGYQLQTQGYGSFEHLNAPH